MSKTNTFENDLLKLIFQNTDVALIGDAGGLQNSAADGSLYVSLHTNDPGEAGDQTTNEVTVGAYGQYARVAVSRTGSTGWTVTGSSVSPTAAINFAQMTTGTGATLSHFGVGTSASGAGKLLYKGAITPNITVANGVTPQLTTATAITEE